MVVLIRCISVVCFVVKKSGYGVYVVGGECFVKNVDVGICFYRCRL